MLNKIAFQETSERLPWAYKIHLPYEFSTAWLLCSGNPNYSVFYKRKARVESVLKNLEIILRSRCTEPVQSCIIGI